MNDPTGSLADVLARKLLDTYHRVQDWDPDDLLNTPVDDLTDYLVNAALVECPQLSLGDRYMLDSIEVDKDFMDFGERLTRRVTRLVLVVPFDGEGRMFGLRADQFSTVAPTVLDLGEHEIQIAIDDPPRDATAVRSAFDGQIANITQYLDWSRRPIEAHNALARNDIPEMVNRRRQELLDTRSLQAEIGFPIKRRADADTYAAPIRRRILRPQRPQPSQASASSGPEPIMAERDYQDALRVLGNQRNALERTPSLAAKLDEEEIRDILLIGLNTQFEGAAGGEVFNGAGKTDILIRVEDRNIFIGECKVWSGPKTMDEALDQLFGYLVWRDSKAAILLFIRNKDVSAVIEKAIDKIEKHPNYKHSSHLKSEDDDQYEFTMRAQDDAEREIRLALIPFALRITGAT